MKHFTNTAYLVTYEQGQGYNRYYGIVSIHNKPAAAQLALDKLMQDGKNDENFKYKNITYRIQEIGLNERKELFAFYY